MTTPSASSSREAGVAGPPQPAPARARASLQISGMTCAACQARVQKALAGAPGVVDASVNLMTAEAAVSFDPAVASPEALLERVRSPLRGV